MVEALGPRRDLWLKLEDLPTRYQLDREGAFFNLGYELGAAAGRTEALVASIRRGARAQRELAARSALSVRSWRSGSGGGTAPGALRLAPRSRRRDHARADGDPALGEYDGITSNPLVRPLLGPICRAV
jgi:hypothetical protein